MIPEKFYGPSEAFWGYRCLTCGNITDHRIEANRAGIDLPEEKIPEEFKKIKLAIGPKRYYREFICAHCHKEARGVFIARQIIHDECREEYKKVRSREIMRLHAEERKRKRTETNHRNRVLRNVEPSMGGMN